MKWGDKYTDAVVIAILAIAMVSALIGLIGYTVGK